MKENHLVDDLLHCGGVLAGIPLLQHVAHRFSVPQRTRLRGHRLQATGSSGTRGTGTGAAVGMGIGTATVRERGNVTVTAREIEIEIEIEIMIVIVVQM